MKIFEITPMSLQVAALATSLDKLIINPTDLIKDGYNPENYIQREIKVWFPGGIGSSRVARVCADNLNKVIDEAVSGDYKAKSIDVGCLARVWKRNWLRAVVIMEYNIRY